MDARLASEMVADKFPCYGYGDWFLAGCFASLATWPLKILSGVIAQSGTVVEPSIRHKCALGFSVATVGASFWAAHLYVPRAYWFWKLTLLPAYPIAIAVVCTAGIALAGVYGTAEMPAEILIFTLHHPLVSVYDSLRGVLGDKPQSNEDTSRRRAWNLEHAKRHADTLERAKDGRLSVGPFLQFIREGPEAGKQLREIAYETAPQWVKLLLFVGGKREPHDEHH